MKIIKTKSFEMAVYARGEESAEKLAIVIPGRLDTKDYLHNTSLVDMLATRGYYALSFDPPGTWESPGDISLYTSTNYLRVIDELIENFGNKPTLLAGHSRGGTVAMLAAPTNPHVTHFIPIFSYYGAPSTPEPDKVTDGIYMDTRDLPPGIERTTQRKEFALPLHYFEDGKQYDALEGLRTCTKPKLFFYGTEDTDNDPEDVKAAYDAASEPKMIHGIHSDHDYRLHPEAVAEVNRVIGEFLDAYPT